MLSGFLAFSCKIALMYRCMCTYVAAWESVECGRVDPSLLFPNLQKMPEEQAFSVLVKLMYNYGHRDVFKVNFQNLHLRFYQLDRLMEVRTC